MSMHNLHTHKHMCSYTHTYIHIVIYTYIHNLTFNVLLRRRRTLDGDACCPHEGGCPPQLLQVAIQLVPQ